MKKAKNIEIKKEKNNISNENNLSDFTEKEVFKGGINNIEKQNNNNYKLKKKENSHIFNTSHNILQNLIKQDNQNITNNNNNSFHPNTSITSSGFISFRNKKARFVNLNSTNNLEYKIEEEIDPKLITQSILMKLGTNGKINYLNSSFSKENNIIESTKENEIEIDEKDLKRVNTNSSKSNNSNNNNSIFSGENNLEEEENEKNVFWNLNSNKDKIINEYNNFEELNNKNDNKLKEEKYLNSIICNLSMIKKGKAIFISQDDIIFVLPSFFIPQNIKIGNTYKLKIKELFKFSKINNEIKELQNQYIK